jgi:serine/threonine protein kinase
MTLPALVDYRDAVQAAGTAFLDPILKVGRARLNQLDLPTVASGGFALTFDVSAAGSRYAVRCFHKKGNQLQQRYAEVAAFVHNHRRDLDFMVEVAYVESGIRVNGVIHPVVRMSWVDGAPLNAWLDDRLRSPATIADVRGQVSTAVSKMHRAGAAHGDLQHGNILVDRDNRVRFVDYDGMFLPALRKLGTAEYGHRNYQHPGRGDSYDDSLDFFSAYVIDLSLAAIQYDPTLWTEFHTGDNLLFSSDDFAMPERSPVLARLTAMPAVADQARLLAAACTADFGSVPAILTGARPAVTLRPGVRARPLTGPVPIRAQDRETLMRRIGDEVTVFGKIRNVHTHRSPKTGKLTTFINFGDYRHAAFVIVAFDRVSHELKPQIDTALKAGVWVSVTGLLEPYPSRWSKELSPEIELRWTGSMRKLDLNQIEQLTVQARSGTDSRAQTVDTPSPTTRPAANTYRLGLRPPEPIASQRPAAKPAASADDLEQRIGRLYRSPGFVAPAPPSQLAPPYQQPPYQQPWYQQPTNQWPAHPPRPARLNWWSRLRRRLGL